MKMGKTSVFILYILLVIFWLALNFIGSREGIGNTIFGLFLGLYSFLFGIALFVLVVKSLAKSTSGWFSSLFALSMCFFGAGTVVWFIYESVFNIETPYPSFSDIFYSLQFPVILIGLFIYFFSMREKGTAAVKFSFKKASKPIAVSAAVLLTILAAALTSSYLYTGGNLDLETFLTFYFPIESFAVVCASAVLYVISGIRAENKENGWFVFLILGNVTWFTADCFFFYEYISGQFFEAGYSDFLYLTGVFLIFVSILELLEESFGEETVFSENIVYFVKTSLSIPVGLNLKDSFRK